MTGILQGKLNYLTSFKIFNKEIGLQHYDSKTLIMKSLNE